MDNASHAARHMAPAFLALAALAWAGTAAGQDISKTADGVDYEPTLMCDGTPCGIEGVLVRIDPAKRSIGLTSGTKYSSGKSGGAITDDLVGYTIKAGSVATFSGAYPDMLNAYEAAAGGIKVAGDTVASFDPNWKSSAVLCAEPLGGGLDIALNDTPLDARGLFSAGQDCVQYGPVIFSDTANGTDLHSAAQADMPNLDWSSAADRSTLLQFRDGSIGFLYTENATMHDIAKAIPGLGLKSGGVDTAINLNSGDWSGYIVRTEENALFDGAIDKGFPSAFVVK